MMLQDPESILTRYPETSTDESVPFIYELETTGDQVILLVRASEASTTSIPAGLTTFDVSVLREVARLRREVETIKGLIIHELDEMPKEELKEVILKHVQEHGAFWPDELADELNLDPFDVIDACEELVNEGRLKPLNPEEVPRADE